jgi:hypothetical protein
MLINKRKKEIGLMIENNTLLLKRRPSSLATLYKGFCAGKLGAKVGEKLPELESRWSDVKLTQHKVDQFSDICEIDKTTTIPPLFPFTLIYPVNLRLLSQKQADIPMFKMLTIRNSTICYREIQSCEKLDVVSRITGQRFVPKGLEFYIHSWMTAGTEKVWENISTLFIPARIQPSDSNYMPPGMMPIPEAKVIDSWYLPATDRLRFAWIMGDSNGIHYSSWWARKFRFKRDFAQPVRIASKCLDLLVHQSEKYPNQIDLMFKGPVYYEKELTMKGAVVDSNYRFDLYCQGNERPCICGEFSYL